MVKRTQQRYFRSIQNNPDKFVLYMMLNCIDIDRNYRRLIGQYVYLLNVVSDRRLAVSSLHVSFPKTKTRVNNYKNMIIKASTSFTLICCFM